MNLAADIQDRKSLEAWLKTQPRDVCVLIGARSACRVLPFINAYKNEDPSMSSVFLSVLWALNTSLIALNSTKPHIKYRAAADAAYSAAAAAATTAATTAATATAAAAAITAAAAAGDANAAAYASYAAAAHPDHASVFTILRNEALALDRLAEADRSAALNAMPLWPETTDEDSQSLQDVALREWAALRERLKADDAKAAAAIAWYDRLLQTGYSQNQAYEFARIEAFETHYNKEAKGFDAAAIYAVLAEIEDRYYPSKLNAIQDIAKKTPLAETLSLDEDRGVYDVEFVPVIDLYGKNLSRIADSLASVISSNAFSENAPEMKFLRDMMNTHKDDPQRIHDDSKYIHDHIQNLITKEVIADSFAVGTLLNALSQTMLDIVANDEDVEQAVEARVMLNMNDQAQISDAMRLVDSIEQIASILSNVLQQDTRNDTQILIAGDSARLNAAYRMLSRHSRIFLDVHAREGAKAGTVHAQPHMEKLVEQLPNIERVLDVLKPYLG